jgi:hypothetical protein
MVGLWTSYMVWQRASRIVRSGDTTFEGEEKRLSACLQQEIDVELARRPSGCVSPKVFWRAASTRLDAALEREEQCVGRSADGARKVRALQVGN